MTTQTHDKLADAAAECLRLEREANATMEGADIAAIINDVAARWGLAPVDLGKAFVDSKVMGPG